jgi:hypothetical protein
MVKYDVDAFVFTGKINMLRALLHNETVTISSFAKIPKSTPTSFPLLLATKPFLIWYLPTVQDAVPAKSNMLDWLSDHFR